MRKFAAALALTVATIPTHAFAELTSFASYNQITNTRALAFTAFTSGVNNGAGGTLFSRAGNSGTVPAATKVMFDFLVDANGGSDIPALSADYTFLASTHDYATQTAATFEQGGFSGSFSFVYNATTPFTINGIEYSGPVNLLSGTFSNAVLAGIKSGTSGGLFNTALNISDIVFTSDVIQFPNNVEKDFSISLTGASPRFTLSGGATTGDLKSFSAVSTGSFSADPTPVVNGAVPELATWSMMIMGFGLIGGTIRSRRIGSGIRLPSRQAEFA